jgi:hypothetical protein
MNTLKNKNLRMVHPSVELEERKTKRFSLSKPQTRGK